MKKEGSFSPRKARVSMMINYSSQGISVMEIVCKQCEKTLCIDVCGRNAISKDSKTGALMISQWDCNGCGKCINACPNNAIFFPRGYKLPYLCDLCGGDPVCVKYCPTHALRYSTYDEIQREKRMSLMKQMEKIQVA
jgi:Fe-S-cluster-containing hydrogenase component 2